MGDQKDPTGSSVTEAIILVGVVLLFVGIGYVGWKAIAVSDSNSSDPASLSATAEQSAEVITTKADLEEAEKALGEINFDDVDAREAEEQAAL